MVYPRRKRRGRRGLLGTPARTFKPKDPSKKKKRWAYEGKKKKCISCLGDIRTGEMVKRGTTPGTYRYVIHNECPTKE